MNHSLATIVNSNGSLAELPSDAVWKLPDVFQSDELIEALEILWRNTDRRLALGMRAREVISKEHSPRSCAERYATAIEAFYEKARSGRASLINELARSMDLPVEERSLISLSVCIAHSLPSMHSALRF